MYTTQTLPLLREPVKDINYFIHMVIIISTSIGNNRNCFIMKPTHLVIVRLEIINSTYPVHPRHQLDCYTNKRIYFIMYPNTTMSIHVCTVKPLQHVHYPVIQLQCQTIKIGLHVHITNFSSTTIERNE